MNTSNYKGTILEDISFGKQFALIPCAVDMEENKLTFYSTCNDISCSSLYKPRDESWFGSSYEVQCFKLKTFFQYFPWDKYPYIEHIKIDTQANDLRVVKSMEDYIEKVAYITLECDHERFQYDCNKEDSGCLLEQVNSYMTEKGFNIFLLIFQVWI